MNVILFGPNGCGKGTQGAIIHEKYNITQVESGVIFRDNIKHETELGKKAKEYIDKGELVPDEITIPMALNRLKQSDCEKGWLLDGFPRNPDQARALYEALKNEGIQVDYVIEILLDREDAKNRIMGRRLCENDNNHPNNVNIDSLKPDEKDGELVCRICGGKLTSRDDDQDEAAINKRHNIYYDIIHGTLAAVEFYNKESKSSGGQPVIIEVDGNPDVQEVSEDLISQLK